MHACMLSLINTWNKDLHLLYSVLCYMYSKETLFTVQYTSVCMYLYGSDLCTLYNYI